MKIFYSLVSALIIATASGGCSGGGGSSDGGGLSENACGVIGLGTKIVNGASCKGLAKTAVVRVVTANSANQIGFCTGTLISPTAVLTAAHCFPTGTTAAVISSGETIESSRRVTVRRVVIHPQYIAINVVSPIAAFNDVAIAHLAQPLTGITPLPIFVSHKVEAGDVTSIFGYGTDENGNFDGEDLQSGEMRVVEVSSTHIRSDFDGDGSNTCQGDSGGPMFFNVGGTPGIVGITSSGTAVNCTTGDNSLFTNVQDNAALNFIRSEVPGIATI